MIEEGMAGHRSSASEPFHSEVLEHVAKLQRSDPAVRAALAEVGGLEELLGVMEVKPSGTAREKQLVLVEVSSPQSRGQGDVYCLLSPAEADLLVERHMTELGLGCQRGCG